jgi:3-hydroxymyristoyl/3-hydroxydecanoyl-(acyl carrier protein) dehydratase
LSLFPDAGFDPVSTVADGVSRFVVSERSRCFDGHFDGAPILPGVAHVALALSACAEQDGRARTLKSLRDLRLKRPLKPGDEVEVVLTASADTTSVKFEIRCLGQVVTTGVLVFDASDGGHGA